MNGLLEPNQTSGYEWNSLESSRLYHRQKTVSPERPTIQLSELARLETQMVRYEEECRKLIETLRSLYMFEDGSSVAEYLKRHRGVPPILAQAERYLRQVFKDAVFSLRATTDDQGWEMLYAFVQWPGEPEEAIRALNTFDETWWLANSYPAGSSLTFTYRLV